MKQLIKITPTCFLLFALLIPTGPLTAEDQGWMNNSLTIDITSHGTFSFFNELRHYNTFFKNQYLYNWQAGFNYKILKNFHLGLAYKQQVDRKLQFNLKENRFIFEAGWRTRLSRTMELHSRFNAELRRFVENMAQKHIRFRLRLLLLTKMKILKLKIIPFAGIEPIFDTVTDEISENRTLAGVLFPVNRFLRLELGYTRKDQKNRETVHIFNTGIHLAF